MDSETLERLLAELVTRDGTDYGLRERSTEEKVARAMAALEGGRAVLLWNPEIESASLVTPDQVKEAEESYKRDAESVGLNKNAKPTANLPEDAEID